VSSVREIVDSPAGSGLAMMAGDMADGFFSQHSMAYILRRATYIEATLTKDKQLQEDGRI
jgi:hypothetical protein